MKEGVVLGHHVHLRILAIRQTRRVKPVCQQFPVEGFVEIRRIVGGVIELFPCARSYIHPFDVRLRIVLDAA